MDRVRQRFEHGADCAPLRQTVRQVLADGPEAELVEDVLVVLTELVQNVTQHTRDGGELILTRRAGTVLIEVVDGSEVLPRACAPDARRIGGRGLLIVAAVTSTWGTRRTETGKVVWAEFTVEEPALAAAS